MSTSSNGCRYGSCTIMAADRVEALFFELFFELFSGLPRQGPGTGASTRRALGLVPGVGPRTRVLDVGCGTGAQTLVLALSSPSRIVAVDNHRPFVYILNREAQRLGVANRLEARVADMRRLDFADDSFDLIWCEGAIYNVGVKAGLPDWRRLLRPNGHVALTEVCWRKPDPPAECVAFWKREYPAIRDTAALLEAVDACGYRTVGHFPLPASAWWDDQLPAAAGQPDRIPQASPRRAGCAGAGGPLPERNRRLACLVRVLRLRVPRAARPLNQRRRVATGRERGRPLEWPRRARVGTGGRGGDRRACRELWGGRGDAVEVRGHERGPRRPTGEAPATVECACRETNLLFAPESRTKSP